ncbi:MAG: DUF6516 family protein [Anaerolineales bacterium]|nr:DUF6516 family protein [Anaerolineales bacterium]
MPDPADYLAEVELALVSSPTIAEYRTVRAWANTDDGYLRIRATLTNGDFLEAAEYFVLENNQIVTVDYRHHWTDHAKQTLRRRWDNTPDHPELDNFPHHVHIGSKEVSVAGEPCSIIDLLRLLESEIS